MAKLKFNFNGSIVSINGKNIEIKLDNADKTKKFYEKFIDKLVNKYEDYNFKILDIDKIITKDKNYNIFNDKKLKLNSEIETIGLITNINYKIKNNKYYYDILLNNINTPTAIKLYGVFDNPIEYLKINNYIKVKGIVLEVEKKEYEKNIDFNKYIVKIKEIEEFKEEILNIKKNIKFLRRPLCLKSSYGNGLIDEFKIKSRNKEIESYCFVDNNTLNFVMNSDKNVPLGIKFYVDIDEQLYSIYLYVNTYDTEIMFNNKKIKVNEGIKTINELISNSKRQYNNYYVVSLYDILNNKDKFKIGSLDRDGIIFKALLNNNFDTIEKYINIFDILGIEPLSYFKNCNLSLDKIKLANENMRRISIKYNKPFIFNDNAYVLNDYDTEFYKEYKLANKIKEENIKNKENYIKDFKDNDNENIGHFMNYIEMSEELTNQGFNIFDMEYMIFNELLFQSLLPKNNEITVIPNELLVDNNEEDKKKLKELVIINMKNKKMISDEIKKRVSKELKIIFDNNYQKIFLAAYTVIKRSNDLGFLTYDRGTAGCMLICYILGITHTNPLDYKLSPKMFLGPHYEKVPDIDINLNSNIVKDILNELKVYYSNTIRASISTSLKENSIKIQLSKIKSKLDIYYSCYLLNNKTVRIQPHNSGLILLPNNIDTNYLFPIIDYGEEKIPLYPYEFLDKVIPKLDLLSKTDMDILEKVKKYDDNLSLELSEVYDLINKDTSNISELNTDYSKQIINMIKPKCFDDLIAIQGLLHGKGIFNSAKICLNNNLKPITCREDLLEILDSFNINNSFIIMEKIRKGNYGKLTNEELYSLKVLPKLYQETIAKIEYLFPKYHAIAYAKQSYYSAFYNLYKEEIDKKEQNKGNNELSINDIDKFMEDF